MKKITALAAAAAIAVSAFAAEAQSPNVVVDDTPSAPAMAFDLVVVRPLSLVVTVAGAGLYVLQLPIAMAQMDFSTPAKKLIVEPAQYTFTRPLGESW